MNKNSFRNYISFVVIMFLIAGTLNMAAGQRTGTPLTAKDGSAFLDTLAPVIATEKSSYKIGETINITGKGYNRFEQVSVKLESYNESTGQTITLGQWDVVADGGGRISTTYNFNFLSLPDSGDNFVIIASGSETKPEAKASIEASIPATFVSGNPSCATLNANNTNFPSITSNFGFKINAEVITNNGTGTFPLQNGAFDGDDFQAELTGGAPTDASNSVTTNVSGSTLTSWSSTLSIDAVIVKGGPNANVYVYTPESLGDINLITPNNGGFGVSHVEFCYDYESTVKIIKQAFPKTPQDFTFTASGAGAVSNNIPNFTLDDDGGSDADGITNMISFPITNFGAGNPITITEDMAGSWQLRPGTGISCTQSGPASMNNNTIDFANRNVTIIVEQNESVTCTFINDLVLAAGANITGKINNLEGRGFKSISLTATVLSTGEKFYTNSDRFGNYRFEGLPVNENYLITIKARNFQFEPDSKIVSLDGDLADIDFNAIPADTRNSK